MEHTDARLHKVEEAGKIFGETQRKMDEKLDLIHKLLTQGSFTTEFGSAQNSPPNPQPSPTPPPEHLATMTADEMAFLKKQEATGKISLHTQPFLHTSKFPSDPSSSEFNQFSQIEPTKPPEHGYVYTEHIHKPNPLDPETIPFQ